MRNFTDKNDKVWGVEITLPVLRRVKRDTEINLMEIMADNGALLVSLEQDPVMLSEVVWAIVQPQASDRSLSREEFEQLAFDSGDRVQEMLLRVVEATADFFPSDRRTAAMSMIHAGVEIEKLTMAAATKEIAKTLDKARGAKKSKKSTSDSVQSLEPTQTV